MESNQWLGRSSMLCIPGFISNGNIEVIILCFRSRVHGVILISLPYSLFCSVPGLRGNIAYKYATKSCEVGIAIRKGVVTLRTSRIVSINLYTGGHMNLIKHLNEVAKYRRIEDPKEERELLTIAKKKLPDNASKKAKKVVTDARNTIVLSNVLWVARIAKKYAGNAAFAKTNRYSSLDDLYGHGISGLYEAIDKYNLDYRTDAGKTVRFITYATWYIHKTLLTVIYGKDKLYLEYSMIRIPASLKSSKLLRRTSEKHYASTGIPMSDEELSKETKMSLDVIKNIRKMEQAKYCISDIKLNWEHKQDESELFNPKLLKRAFRVLTERQKYVITNYFGIGCEPKVLVQIAAELKVTKQAVHDAKRMAIKSIKQYLEEKHNIITAEAFYETA